MKKSPGSFSLLGKLFILAIVLIAQRSLAQNILFRSYDVNDGLAGNKVYSSYQDKSGFMWFCTETGVSRFDGSSFTNFTVEEGLEDNDILGLFEDRQGRIWFQCFNQRPCFFYKNKIYNESNFPELAKIKDYSWLSHYEDTSAVWIGGKACVYKFENNQVFTYKAESIPIAVYANFIFEMNGKIYTNFNGVYRVDEAQQRLVANDVHGIIPGNVDTYVAIDQNRFISRGTYKNGMDSVFYNVIKDNRRLSYPIHAASKKEIFIASVLDEELIMVAYRDKSIEIYQFGEGLFELVNRLQFTTNCTSALKDDQGNMWFTFFGGGVKFLPKNYSVEITRDDLSDSDDILMVRGFPNGEMYASDINGNMILIKNDKIEKRWGIHGNGKKINKVTEIYKDKKEKLWISSSDGIFLLDKDWKSTFRMDSIGSVKDMNYDERGHNLLVATHDGAYVKAEDLNSPLQKICTMRSMSIAGNYDSVIWIACMDGLHSFKNGVDQLESAITDSLKSRISSLRIDDNGRLWIATSSNGLFLVENGAVTYHLTTKNGLASNTCKKIFIDEAHQSVWLCTNLGANKIVFKEKQASILIFNSSNYLSDNNVEDIFVAGSKVYVATGSGINVFDDSQINQEFLFSVYLAGITVNDAIVSDMQDGITLEHDQNNINIRFAAINFMANGNVIFDYKIDELSEEFTSTHSNDLLLSKLDPGVYHLRLRAKDVFGNLSAKDLVYRIEILAAWYQRLWVKTIALMAFLSALIFGVFRYTRMREGKKSKEMAMRQMVSKLELEAIRSQINPHFIFNCLNAIQNVILKRDYDGASYFINQFAVLMRKGLELSKENFISIQEEVAFIGNYMEVEKLRLSNSFDYKIVVDEALSISKSLIPAFVIQPLIENSINHGIRLLRNQAGEVSVSFIAEKDAVRIVIEDNGIGLNQSQKIKDEMLTFHHSKGMGLVHQRIHQMNDLYSKEITLKVRDKSELDGNQQGTIVELSVNF
jgi:ligand-binding sensor domain-containing protein